MHFGYWAIAKAFPIGNYTHTVFSLTEHVQAQRMSVRPSLKDRNTRDCEEEEEGEEEKRAFCGAHHHKIKEKVSGSIHSFSLSGKHHSFCNFIFKNRSTAMHTLLIFSLSLPRQNRL